MGQDLNERDELRTERLLLRPFEFGDVEDVASYASDPEVGRYLALPQPYGRADAVEFIASQVLAEWSTRPTFAIVLEGQAVGSVSMRVNAPNDIAEMGYLLGKAQWGKGLMPEAGRAVMDWGFERYGLHKVWAYADLRNRRSWRVMEKLGMTREGVLRGNGKLRDEYVDDVCYGILRDEWEQHE